MDDYNNIAHEFEEYGKDAITDFEIGYENVLKALGDIKGKRVLDYGCGTGKFTRILKDRGSDVVGVDIAEKELAIARPKYPDISFFAIRDMADKVQKGFDFATLNFVISAIPSQETIVDIFKNIRDFLKPSGHLVMMNSNYEKSPGRQFFTFAIGEVTPKTGAPLKVYLGADRSLVIEDYFYSKEDYINMLKQAGFSVEKTLEPLANNLKYPWRDEVKYPPFMIISAIVAN